MTGLPAFALVKVLAAGCNNTDLWTREGAYGLPGDPDALAGQHGERVVALAVGHGAALPSGRTASRS